MRLAALCLLIVPTMVSGSCASRDGAKQPAAARDAGAAAQQPTAAPAKPSNDRVRVQVDHRVELFAILFRLAGNPEYGDPFATPYLQAVDRQFAPHASHPAVEASRALRASRGISYNAPVGLAVYLEADWSFQPLRPLDPLPPGLDQRWAGAPIDDYLAKVRDFAEQSGYRAFFEGQRDYLAAVEQPLLELLAQHDVVGWFDGLFGARPSATYFVLPGMLTGENSYAATVETADGGAQLYQVINLQNLDAEGRQHPGVFTLDLLVHEIGHAYVNPIVARHAGELEEAAVPVFAAVEQAMRAQAYGNWQTMVNELLVRSATSLYIKDTRGAIAAALDVRGDERKSFVATGALVEQLERLRADGGTPLRAEDVARVTRDCLAAWSAARGERD